MNWYKLFDSVEEAEKTVSLYQTALIRAGTWKICLARTPKGFFAVGDVCSHRGASLHKGIVNEFEEIVCPLHAYIFSLRTGEESTGKNCPSLATYTLKVEDNALWIQI